MEDALVVDGMNVVRAPELGAGDSKGDNKRTRAELVTTKSCGATGEKSMQVTAACC